ncbi:pentapeptide repeat-containing protein [Streptosporangium sp. NPDC050855]|uniref:pentapeptide repeat-containing protein n=1 Tax=Streptosporangium sp. NPDC050855 TaxID=3366194 RepID=UPI00379D7617
MISVDDIWLIRSLSNSIDEWNGGMSDKWVKRALVGVALGAAAMRMMRSCPQAPARPEPEPSGVEKSSTPEEPEPVTFQPRRRRLWIFVVIATLCMSAASGVSALNVAVPDWVRWVCFGIALTGVVSLALALLLGPGARRLAGERRPLTDEDRRELSAHERVEAINAARHTLIQAATGLVVIGGVVFTAQGLWYTAQSLETSRQAQSIAEQGQITDRYTKAVEQLGSTKDDVRLGGIYALERLANDSPRDKQTIYDVLTAFVRQHDPKPTARLPKEPATDVQAALTVFGRRKIVNHPDLYVAVVRFDLREVRIKGANLRRASLIRTDLRKANLRDAGLNGADLRNADLNSSNLSYADLSYADLDGAYLSGADLSGADLSGASLRGVDLRGLRLNGTDLGGTDLRGADLRGMDLRRVDLSVADLRNANLSGANLISTDLHDTDLSGADLRGSLGLSERSTRVIAKTDANTLFGPMPAE